MKSTSHSNKRFAAHLTRLSSAVLIGLWGSVLMGAAQAHAAQLVMFESATCEWCERFHEEIGPIYPKTKEARCAPLRRVDVHDPRPDDLAHIQGVIYTPTFVLIDHGQEIDRITGYPGEDFFWGQLAQALGKLTPRCILP